jgi:hypothetical protein
MSIPKTLSALLCLLLWAQTSVLRAQTRTGVGINTENLQGVFQVDAAANNNPPPQSIPAAQQTDDVVITEDGHVGIGTLAPSAKLHVHTQYPNRTGVAPLRVADGSQGADKMLTSDGDGAVSWQMPVPPPPSAVYPIQVVPTQTFAKGAATQATNSAFTVPEDGFYSMDVRFWGESNPLTTYDPNIQTITRFQLRRGTAVVDEFQYNEPSRIRVTCFVTLYAPALQGDVLSLWVWPVEGFAMTANPSPNYEWIKTKVLYKKLGVNDETNYFD